MLPCTAEDGVTSLGIAGAGDVVGGGYAELSDIVRRGRPGSEFPDQGRFQRPPNGACACRVGGALRDVRHVHGAGPGSKGPPDRVGCGRDDAGSS